MRRQPKLQVGLPRARRPVLLGVGELLEQEEPDGAIVSTPNDDHASVVEFCGRRSVHVLIEKPIAGTMEDASRIIRTADETGIKALVGHHRRHSPYIREARSILKGGSLRQAGRRLDALGAAKAG